MGHEGAGVVEAVGPGVRSLSRRAAGRAVVARPVRRVPGLRRGPSVGLPGLPVVPPPDARRRHGPGRPRRRRRSCPIAGSARWPSATVVPEAAAIALPDGVDPAVAALIGCCVTTGVGAVLKTAAGAGRRERGGHRARWRRAVVRDGRGAGGRRADRGGRPGRGQAGRGARPSARPTACSRPMTGPRPIEALRDLTDGGPDFVFEAIGRPATVELAIECAAARRDGGARRDDAGRGAGVVRGLPVRRRQPADPRLELRVRRPAGRLPALRRAPPRRPAPGRAAHRPPHRARRPRSAFDRLRAGDGLRQVVVFD